jgi:hypothetical protein
MLLVHRVRRMHKSGRGNERLAQPVPRAQVAASAIWETALVPTRDEKPISKTDSKPPSTVTRRFEPERVPRYRVHGCCRLKHLQRY